MSTEDAASCPSVAQFRDFRDRRVYNPRDSRRKQNKRAATAHHFALVSCVAACNPRARNRRCARASWNRTRTRREHVLATGTPRGPRGVQDLFCSRPRVSSRSRTMSPTATAYVCSRFSMVSNAGEWMSVWYMCGNRESGVSSSALA